MDNVISFAILWFLFPPKSHSSRMSSWGEIVQSLCRRMLCMSGFQGFSPTHFLGKNSMLFSLLMRSGDVNFQLPETNTALVSNSQVSVHYNRKYSLFWDNSFLLTAESFQNKSWFWQINGVLIPSLAFVINIDGILWLTSISSEHLHLQCIPVASVLSVAGGLWLHKAITRK